MEWFDFGLYSYLAVIISQNFFSGVENDELKLVFTFATFAIAFLIGWLVDEAIAIKPESWST